MPELPEVETVVRGLREPLVGRMAGAVWTDWERIIDSPPFRQFADRIRGQQFRAITRRAKFIVCQLDHDFLIVHLRMTGRLYVVPDDAVQDADRWLHFGVQLDNGTQLRFSDARKFGRVWLTADMETVTGKLGPEPLADDFTLDVLRDGLKRRSKKIKPLLLDQTFVAGVGNIYADEALHRAKIHPLRRADELTDAEIVRLHEMVRTVLSDGIDYEGASVNWYRKPDGTPGESQNHLFVYGRDGEACLNCGTLIEKIRVGQRGTHFCPNCQK